MVSIVENTESNLKIIGVYDTRVLRGILEGNGVNYGPAETVIRTGLGGFEQI